MIRIHPQDALDRSDIVQKIQEDSKAVVEMNDTSNIIIENVLDSETVKIIYAG